MTVEADHSLYAGILRGWRSDLERRYLELFELPLNKKVPRSPGDRTKLMLLLAMARGADLLLLDEPTEASTEMIEQVLAAFTGSPRRRNHYLLLSHQLAEVEQMPTGAIIDRGRVVVGGDLDRSRCDRTARAGRL